MRFPFGGRLLGPTSSTVRGGRNIGSAGALGSVGSCNNKIAYSSCHNKTRAISVSLLRVCSSQKHRSAPLSSSFTQQLYPITCPPAPTSSHGCKHPCTCTYTCTRHSPWYHSRSTALSAVRHPGTAFRVICRPNNVARHRTPHRTTRHPRRIPAWAFPSHCQQQEPRASQSSRRRDGRSHHPCRASTPSRCLDPWFSRRKVVQRLAPTLLARYCHSDSLCAGFRGHLALRSACFAAGVSPVSRYRDQCLGAQVRQTIPPRVDHDVSKCACELYRPVSDHRCGWSVGCQALLGIQCCGKLIHGSTRKISSPVTWSEVLC
jgi:hypothetical protein